VDVLFDCARSSGLNRRRPSGCSGGGIGRVGRGRTWCDIPNVVYC